MLLLRYQAELGEAEIAETLDISPGSVKTHASRGLVHTGGVDGADDQWWEIEVEDPNPGCPFLTGLTEDF